MEELYSILDTIQSSDYFGISSKPAESGGSTYNYTFSNGKSFQFKYIHADRFKDEIYHNDYDDPIIYEGIEDIEIVFHYANVSVKDNQLAINNEVIFKDYRDHEEEIDYLVRSAILIRRNIILYEYWISKFPSTFKYNTLRYDVRTYLMYDRPNKYTGKIGRDCVNYIWTSNELKQDFVLDGDFDITKKEFSDIVEFFKSKYGEKTSKTSGLIFNMGLNEVFVAGNEGDHLYDYGFGKDSPNIYQLSDAECLMNMLEQYEIVQKLHGDMFLYYDMILERNANRNRTKSAKN